MRSGAIKETIIIFVCDKQHFEWNAKPNIQVEIWNILMIKSQAFDFLG